MDKNFYKNFAQKFVLFNIDDCEWFCGRYNGSGDVFLHIVVSTKRENESSITFRFGSDYCIFCNDIFTEELHEEWMNYKNARKNSEIIK